MKAANSRLWKSIVIPYLSLYIQRNSQLLYLLISILVAFFCSEKL